MSEQELKQVEQINKKVSEILDLLSGNRLDKDDRGLVGDVNDHEFRITKLEKLKDKAIWILIGMTFPGGYGIATFFGWLSDHLK